MDAGAAEEVEVVDDTVEFIRVVEVEDEMGVLLRTTGEGSAEALADCVAAKSCNSRSSRVMGFDVGMGPKERVTTAGGLPADGSLFLRQEGKGRLDGAGDESRALPAYLAGDGEGID